MVPDTASRISFDSGRISAEPVLNWIFLRMTMLLSSTTTLPRSGQPSSSRNLLNVSGSFGQRSFTSGDAVVVVVGLGASVLVLEAVFVLGVVRALVARVGDAVVVAVAVLRGLGAAVGVLVAVHVLGDVGALVLDVRDAVVVVVGLGAPVLVLEAVEIFLFVRALVEVVLDAVTVAIADGGLEDEAHEGAHVGRLEAARVPGAGAEHEVAVPLDEDLESRR
jgi:hypothetical protein